MIYKRKKLDPYPKWCLKTHVRGGVESVMVNLSVNGNGYIC